MRSTTMGPVDIRKQTLVISIAGATYILLTARSTEHESGFYRALCGG